MRTAMSQLKIQRIPENVCSMFARPAAFEAIYRLLNPYKDPLGLALYFKPTLGDDEKELEWKVIPEKIGSRIGSFGR